MAIDWAVPGRAHAIWWLLVSHEGLDREAKYNCAYDIGLSGTIPGTISGDRVLYRVVGRVVDRSWIGTRPVVDRPSIGSHPI